jgi:molecular chaperone GrpE
MAREVLLSRDHSAEVMAQVTEKRRLRRDDLTSDEILRGSSADGADLASTDMSADPSSRQEESQPDFGGGVGGLPVEPQAEAVRRLESQLEEVREQHLRLAAEFDNYRKRVARERAELTDRAQAALVSRLLDVLDDMDRLSGDTGNATPDALRHAIELVTRKLDKELSAAGLERIDPVGKPFDPSLHEAVSTVAPPSPAQDHQVSATFQAGYRFKGTLVRPARVQVYSEQAQA